MPGSFLLAAAVVAVLTPREVVFVDATSAAVVRRVELPGEGLAAFAAPDGRIVVPLAGGEGTAVVAGSGAVVRWPGRVFPLFFREPDRMYVVLPGVLATLSYPERVPITRTSLPGLTGARRAACSADGRLVAVVPEGGAGRTLLLVPALERGAAIPIALGGEPSLVAIGPDGGFAVAVSDGRSLALIAPGADGGVRGILPLAATVRALGVSADGRGVLVGLAAETGGELVGVRVEPGSAHPFRIEFRTALAAPVTAVGTAGGELVALAGGNLVVLAANGRHVLRTAAVAGATDLAVEPARPLSLVPAWSDAAAP